MKLIKRLSIILAIITIIVLGINYTFFKPTEINTFIASKIYKTPANSEFNDDDFYKCVVDNYNSEKKTEYAYTYKLTDTQLSSLNKLTCRWSKNYNIRDTTGLEKMTGLTYLDLEGTVKELNKIDVSKNTNLIYLYLTSGESFVLNGGSTHGSFSTKITELDITNNINLKELHIENSELTYLDISNNINLEVLEVGHNELQQLDISNNTALTYLGISNNNLSSIDVNNNKNIKYLNLHNNPLTEIAGLDKLSELLKFSATEGTLNSLNITNNQKLTYLEVSYNQLTSLDVSKNTALTSLDVGNNQLTSLDVNNNTALTYLSARDNQLTSLDVSKNTALTHLYTPDNQLTSLDVSKNTVLKYLDASHNQLTSLDLSNNTALTSLTVYFNQLTSLDLSNNTALQTLNARDNQLTSLDVSQNVALFSLDVSSNQLTSLDLSNNTALRTLNTRDNQLTSLDVSNNTALQTLYVYSNQLTSLDVSNNTALTYLDASYNPYKELRYVYKGDVLQLENRVKLPEQLNWSSPTWTAKDNSMATVDSNGLVTTLKNGTVDIIGEVKSKYTTTSTINIAEITSDKYLINEKDNYIYIGIDNNIDIIKESINISHEEISLSVDLDNSKLQVKHNEDILKEFKIIKINSTEYDLNKEYIYTRINQFDITKINVINGTKEIKDNKLQIKYEDVVLQSYDLVRITSETYDLSKEYIYTGINQFDITKINVINGTKEIKDNKLQIKYEDIVLQSYDLVRITSETYDLSKEYIYTRINQFNIEKVNIINGTILLENNKLLFKYNDVVLKEIGIISLKLNGLELMDDNIYISNMDIEKLNDKISVIGGTFDIKDKQINISFDEKVIHEIKLLSIDLGNLKVSSKLIIIDNNISYSDIVSNIILSESLSYKIINNKNEEITDVNINDNYMLKIYYKDREVESYTITHDYLYFDETIKVDDKYLSNISLGSKVKEFVERINTSGIITITNNKNQVITGEELIGTGSKVSIKFNNKTVEYQVIINGDIDGDGLLKLTDIMKMANYIYKNKNSLSGVYEMATDFDKNGSYNLQDIMKCARAIY